MPDPTPHPDVVRRWHSGSQAVLRSMDNKWAMVAFVDDEPTYQSSVVCSCVGVERADFGWMPPSWNWLHRASVDARVPGYQFDGRLRRSGPLTVVFLGELAKQLEPDGDVPEPVPTDVHPYDLVTALSAGSITSWVMCSFDENGKLDDLGNRPSRALAVDADDESWVPEDWRVGNHRINDAITGTDGVTRLVSGELAEHDRGTLAVFQVHDPRRAEPWSPLQPWIGD
ncbi:MAG: hypothetical protein GXP35_05425 [Actinobacteria bacterium]|nr:hypothetical protein [Actinomycetota bacterium]